MSWTYLNEQLCYKPDIIALQTMGRKKGTLLGNKQVHVAKYTSALADRTALMYLITPIRLTNSGEGALNCAEMIEFMTKQNVFVRDCL